MTLIETGTINNFVRQDDPSVRELEKAFNQRIKKHMKKHYDDYICLSPIQNTNEQFVFEIGGGIVLTKKKPTKTNTKKRKQTKGRTKKRRSRRMTKKRTRRHKTINTK